MISIETEARVARILLTLADGERKAEICRKSLCEDYDFDPYQLFRYLDLEGKNRVDAQNIMDYLRQKGTFCTHIEAQFIILFYDEDGDGSLSYCEFLSMVQTGKLNHPSTFNMQKDLPFNVDYTFTKFLEKELNMVKKNKRLDLIKMIFKFILLIQIS